MKEINIQECKNIGELKCKKYSGDLALIFLVYTILTGIGSLEVNVDLENINRTALITSSVASIAGLILAGPLTYGIIGVIKNNYDEIKPTLEHLFEGFKYFSKAFVLHLLETIYIALWSLLLIIPGIIKAFAYSMAFHIYHDNPELTASECLKKSEEMMQGHKMTLFKLQFSYFGWLLLCVLTLGILTLWVAPKMQTATYEFYLRLKGENKEVVFEEKNVFEDLDKKFDELDKL